MKKSKFVLLSLVLIVLLSFSLFFIPVGVKAASDGELDVDIDEYWVGLGWPLSAMNYKDVDGKGIKFYVEFVSQVESEGSIYRFIMIYSVKDYFFADGSIFTYEEYPLLYQFCSESLISVFNYYYDTYELLETIPEFDRILVIWDVDKQMFVGPDYLSYCIDDGYHEGYQEGIIANHEAAYYEGYNTGYGAGYEVGYAAARPNIDILLITLIMFLLSIFIYFKFRIKWVLIATILLWFVPIFLVENLFIKIFSVIMILVTITITFFSEREEDYE
jgi:hypothetical protein